MELAAVMERALNASLLKRSHWSNLAALDNDLADSCTLPHSPPFVSSYFPFFIISLPLLVVFLCGISCH